MIDILSPVTSAVTSALSVKESRSNRRFNRDEAKKNREFQEMMSNTEVQRRRADLVKAGINPILAANMSGGSGTPSGSSASSSSMPELQAPEFDVSSASDMLTAHRSRKLIKAQERDINAAGTLKLIDAQTQGLQNLANLDNTLADIEVKLSNKELNEERRKNLVEERANLIVTRNQIWANIRNINTSSNLNTAKALTEKEEKEKRHIERTIAEKDIARAKREEQWEKSAIGGFVRGAARTVGGILKPR